MSRLNLDIFDRLSLFYSWYIKSSPLDQDIIFTLQFTFFSIVIFLWQLLISLHINLVNPILHCLFTIKLTSFFSIFFAIKFVLLIALLIFVRGGIPRYRYDFLTKLGWMKTLSLVLAFFLINLVLTYL